MLIKSIILISGKFVFINTLLAMPVKTDSQFAFANCDSVLERVKNINGWL